MPAVVVALLCWGVWMLPEGDQLLLVYDYRAIDSGQYWRLWSAHLTHYSLSQLIADSGIVALMGMMASRHIRTGWLAAALIVAMPLMSLLLYWLVPEMVVYRGASGMAAMLWLFTALMLMSQSKRGDITLWIGLLFVLFLVVKVAGEALELFPAVSDLPAGIVVAWQVHLAGMVLGSLLFLLCSRSKQQ